MLGATAVEDALQDNVRDTLVAIRRAGILVWILTGDKIETAFNISKSCGHIAENAKLYFITECKEEHQIHQHLDTISEEISVNLRIFSILSSPLIIEATNNSLILHQNNLSGSSIATVCIANRWNQFKPNYEACVGAIS